MVGVVIVLDERTVRLQRTKLQTLCNDHPDKRIEFYDNVSDGMYTLKDETPVTAEFLLNSDYNFKIHAVEEIGEGVLGVWISLFPKDKKRKPFKEEQI